MRRGAPRRRIVRGNPDSTRSSSIFAALCGIFLFLAALALPARADPFYAVSERACVPAPELPARAEMEAALRDYLRLAEEALAMRARAIRLYRELEAGKDKGPLSGQHLRRINEGMQALLKQREQLFKVALEYECWVDSPPAADPEAADIQRAGVLASLSSALVLYDNYLSAVMLYRNDARLRRHLNRPDRGFALEGDELRKADHLYNSPDIRRRVRRAIAWYLDHGKVASSFEGYDYLFQSIAQSPSFRLVRQKRPLRVLGRTFEIFGDYTLDSLVQLKNGGSHLTSLLFGNTAGLVETRQGKLRGKPEIERNVRGKLQAGDILLEKTPFRLTDTFIPGYWGHAAIWIGSEAELTGLGLWEHPVVRPHQQAIRAGRGIVEALRSGVEMNTLSHFMNIDDLSVLRRAGMSPEARREVLLQALRQVGKDYDFNFDAETTERIFCSKLVYLAYGDIDWPTSRILGRHTISPDDIARRSLGGGLLVIVLMYHDGKPVESLLPAMQNFLK